MVQVRFTERGLYALESELKNIAERGGNLKPILNVIADRMLEHEKEVFQTEGASVGRPWDPISKNTWKKGGQRILHFSGRLEDSLTKRGAEDAILDVTDTYIRFGTRVPYAHFHDEGTSKMPVRHPIMFNRANAREYYKLIQSYVMQARVAERRRGR